MHCARNSACAAATTTGLAERPATQQEIASNHHCPPEHALPQPAAPTPQPQASGKPGRPLPQGPAHPAFAGKSPFPGTQRPALALVGRERPRSASCAANIAPPPLRTTVLPRRDWPATVACGHARGGHHPGPSPRAMDGAAGSAAGCDRPRPALKRARVAGHRRRPAGCVHLAERRQGWKFAAWLSQHGVAPARQMQGSSP